MKIRKLVCGVGVNDSDYVVKKEETIGYVDGKRRYKRHYCKSSFLKSFYKEREVTKHFKRTIEENYES